MKSIDIIVISILLLIVGIVGIVVYQVWKRYRINEGFASDDTNNALLNAMAQMKKVSAHITNPSNWLERFEMMSLSPVDLARRYIKSQRKTE